MQDQPVEIPQPPPAPRGPMTPDQVARIQEQLREQLQVLNGVDPAAAYEAVRAQRRELGQQLERLESKRSELSRERQRQITNGNSESAKGIDARIAEIDKRIADLDKQVAQADVQVARSAAIPGAVQPDEPVRASNGPPEEFIAIPVVFTIFVLFPLAIAYARRIWRRSTPTEVKMPAEWSERMSRLEQNIDTIAVEVERVSEGQRFMTKALVEGNGGRGLGAGAAQPVELGAREAVPAKNR